MTLQRLRLLTARYLREDEARVLTLRFGLVDGVSRTVRQVAEETGLTYARLHHLSRLPLTVPVIGAERLCEGLSTERRRYAVATLSPHCRHAVVAERLCPKASEDGQRVADFRPSD